MKVAHISTNIGGGAGIATLRLHNALLKKGIDSNLLVKDPIRDKSLQNVIGVTHYHNLFDRIKNKLNIPNKVEKLERRINSDYNSVFRSYPYSYYPIEKYKEIDEADIIHLHWIGDFVNFPTFFKSVKNKPIVWTLHDKNPFLGFLHYENDYILCRDNYIGATNNMILKEKIKILKNHKNKIEIVCPSLWLSSQSQKSELFTSLRHQVIPNLVNEVNSTSYNNRLLKNEFQINDNPTFLFIADYLNLKWKGFDVLKEALENIKSPVNLIVIGRNVDYVEIENRFITITRVNYITDRDLINKYYSAVDFTILPTFEDNLPNVMLESFMNGTPVISFSNGGMAEHINYNNGILIDEISSDKLKIAIEQGIESKTRFDREKIKQYYQETFSYENTTQKYIDLYKSLL